MNVELHDVRKTYGETVAVEDLSLRIEHGEFVALLGPSGCGKTTTLRMIGGFIKPDRGQIMIGGQDISGVPPYERNLGVVFQSYALFPHMTVADNVAFGLKMRNVSKAERKERVERALDLVQLSGLGHRMPRALSGGQQQRVALARAIAIEPQALLLDEPLSNLDAKLREEMRLELKSIQRRLGITTIFVTHDQEEALVMADRVAVMQAGKLEQVGTPTDLYERPASKFVAHFIGTTNFIRGVVTASDADGRTVLKAADSVVITGQSPAPLRAGQHAAAAIRPERIEIVAAGNGHPSGRVDQVVYLGPTVRYQIALADGQRLLAETANRRDLAPVNEGDAVGLSWNAEDVLIFPKEALARA